MARKRTKKNIPAGVAELPATPKGPSHLRFLPSIAPNVCCLAILLPLYLLFRHHVLTEILYVFAWAATACLSVRFKWNKMVLWTLVTPILISLSMPDINLNGFIFIAFIPMLIALRQARSLVEAVYLSVSTGFFSVFLVNQYMVQAASNICETNTFVSLLIFIPFSFAMMAKFLFLAFFFRLNRRWLSVPEIVFLPAVMGVTELAGFEIYPWTFALSVSEQLRLIQAGDLIGTAGISSLILFFNVILLHVWDYLKKERPDLNLREIGVGVVVLILWFGYGHVRLDRMRALPETGPSIEVAVVQPNSPAGVHDSSDEVNREICENLKELTHDVLRDCTPDLIVFPEGAGAMGYFVDVNPIFRETYSAIAEEASCPIIVDNYSPVQAETGWIIYRSALLLSPDEEVIGQYHKQKLVPFGEYIPLVNRFPVLRKIFKNVGARAITKPGTDFPVWNVNGVNISPQMCFEGIYPGMARRSVREGADLLVNISNDAWYGGGKEPEQHLKLTLFRCIENRVPMVRCTNSGISAYLLPTGEIWEPRSPIGQQWTDCRPLFVGRRGSLYSKYGEWFAWLCFAFVAIGVGKALMRRRSKRRVE